jgi:prepilin-type N-terminal cleavage/methylation domain-containing protein
MSRAARPAPARRSRGGFTIVELLVVISILATIIGILLPALGTARASSRKTEELNNIRPLYTAWNLYAGQNEDAALPGWVAPAVQADWQVTYRLPDGFALSPEQAAPYPWRIMKFLDNNTDIIIGRVDSAAPNLNDIADDIAYRPQFGYNGLYIGGYYEPPTTLAPAGAGGAIPARPRYSLDNVVAQRISQVGGTPRTVVFCASASTNPDDGPLALEPGLHKNFSDATPGCHLVVPPVVAGIQVWASGGGGPSSGAGPQAPTSVASMGLAGGATQLGQAPAGGGTGMQLGDIPSPTSILVFSNQLDPQPGVPLLRYTKAVAVAWSDGSTSAETPGALCDWRKWIPRAATVHEGGGYGAPGGYPDHEGD